MSEKKRDVHARGEEEEERIGDEARLDDFNDQELESSACPICREDYCSKHLVAATCSDDADVRGVIDGVWESGMSLAWAVLKRAYLEWGKTTGAGAELDALLRELQSCNQDATDDGFDEAIASVGADYTLRDLLLGELYALPDVIVRDYVHPGGMPGLSSSGTNCYAADPNDAAGRWLGRVMTMLWINRHC
ncbi:hypothetical protein [Thauera chlorobenzoica]|uniref:Uncharacterized protein n=1 Tax=Thauera chlorobenzoica TaxID=96773 RepID=A0A1H5SF10_9RHOO|nr:hypothetical protein [Thauera chlorobenzoica]APR04829.1 hypothetical protein Tchl_1982 [Thauera chlorobenzoica]SEF49192.1 hypothetical protein SAMN05216242_101493 [Thauera chlorobenzoica]